MLYQLQHLLADSLSRHGPDRIAVCDGARSLSYGDLAGRAAGLGGLLSSRGLSPGDRVALFLPKSLEAVVSIFGVLTSGGVYVPIDPHGPAARAALIVRDCHVRHVVTTAERAAALARALGEDAPRIETWIVVGEGEAGVGGEVPWELAVATPPIRPHDGVETDLAYILYTSGSTGVPKGVMISHRAALQFVCWSHEEFGLGPEDVVSSHAPFHFDLSIFDLFASVCAGARVVLVPDGLSTFPIKLTHLIREEGITVWYSVPSVLVLMLTRGRLADTKLPTLRLILFAGEVFPLKYLRQLRRATEARLFNLYGPTETNVCTFHEVRAVPSDAHGGVPIGMPTPYYEIIVVRDDGGPAGRGESGELYARGPGLMNGYWGDAERTSSVLVPDPLRPWQSDRVCRTGDIVTVRPDGALDYIGRRDHMVKIRGNRVELGEIEAALHRYPTVSEAAVLALDDGGGSRLHACVVVDSVLEDESEITTFLAGLLPSYMVPAAVEIVTALPKTSTGKVDRRRLLAERS